MEEHGSNECLKQMEEREIVREKVMESGKKKEKEHLGNFAALQRAQEDLCPQGEKGNAKN